MAGVMAGMTPSVGLTGGVASGKTTVANAFTRLGVPVVDADQIARDVVAPGEPALGEIVQPCGAEILDDNGALSRPAMRKIVFNDDTARRRLEAIVHPRVGEGLERARRETTATYLVIVVPLLVESGLRDMMDRVLVVDVPEAVQLERLQRRDGIEPELARRMMEAQASREQRLAIADDIFVN